MSGNNAIKESLKAEKLSKRVWEIDTIRGVAIIGMIINHFLYDIALLPSIFPNFYSVNNSFIRWLYDSVSSYIQTPTHAFFHSLAFLFLLISGISCLFSKNNLKHGIKILIAGIIIDLITYIIFWVASALYTNKVITLSDLVSVDIRIVFGVLWPLAIGALLITLTKKLPYSKWINLVLALGCFTYGLVFGLTSRNLHFSSGDEMWIFIFRIFDQQPVLSLTLPPFNYDWFTNITGMSFVNFLKAGIGLVNVGSDYFALIPWVGFSFLGAFLGQTVYKEKKSLLPKLDGKWHKPIDFFGNHALIVYITHQFILMGLLIGICEILGYRIF